MSLANYQILLAGIIQDTANKLDRVTRDAAIAAAVATYCRHRPLLKVATLTGDGTAYDFAVPTDWEDGVSSIVSIENPVDKQEPEVLDEAGYRIVRHPTTGLPRIRFISLVLASAEKAYVNYSVSHTLSGTTDTIPVADRLAVAKLAGAECARMLAAYYSQTSDATYGADTVNYRTKGQDYLALAKALELAYREHVGAVEGFAPASVAGDLDVDLQNFAGPPFYHSNLSR